MNKGQEMSTAFIKTILAFHMQSYHWELWLYFRWLMYLNRKSTVWVYTKGKGNLLHFWEHIPTVMPTALVNSISKLPFENGTMPPVPKDNSPLPHSGNRNKMPVDRDADDIELRILTCNKDQLRISCMTLSHSLNTTLLIKWGLLSPLLQMATIRFKTKSNQV